MSLPVSGDRTVAAHEFANSFVRRECISVVSRVISRYDTDSTSILYIEEWTKHQYHLNGISFQKMYQGRWYYCYLKVNLLRRRDQFFDGKHQILRYYSRCRCRA